jgi:hypothetical protein
MEKAGVAVDFSTGRGIISFSGGFCSMGMLKYGCVVCYLKVCFYGRDYRYFHEMNEV